MFAHRWGLPSRIWLLTTLFFVPAADAGSFDSILDRMQKSTVDHIGDLGEKGIDKTFDGANQAVECAVGDKECLRRKQAAEAAAAPQPAAAPATGTARCVETDVACLRDAKQRGLHVEIVDESQIDTIRCTIDDAACMRRAKEMGKKVELID
jgi:hypothetical protein